MESIRLIIGGNIQRLRERRGLTMAELARKARVSQSQLHRIEHGLANSRLDTLQLIARALQVQLSTLFRESLSKQPLIIAATEHVTCSIGTASATLERDVKGFGTNHVRGEINVSISNPQSAGIL